MKVYVAGSSKEIERCEAFIARCREERYEITPEDREPQRCVFLHHPDVRLCANDASAHELLRINAGRFQDFRERT